MSTASKEGGKLWAKLVGRHVVHVAVTPESYSGGVWTHKTEHRDVILMAVSGKYAMVRRPGCAPYVAGLKEILPATPPANEQDRGEATPQPPLATPS
jgi:hypothetical protein